MHVSLVYGSIFGARLPEGGNIREDSGILLIDSGLFTFFLIQIVYILLHWFEHVDCW